MVSAAGTEHDWGLIWLLFSSARACGFGEWNFIQPPSQENPLYNDQRDERNLLIS